jgi:hypothetical protein
MENVTLRCTINGHHKEYRIEPDPVALRVVGRHGRIGTKLAPTNYQCDSIDAVRAKAAALEAEKLKKGYDVVSRTPVAGDASGTAPTSSAPAPASAIQEWRLSVTVTKDDSVKRLEQLVPTMVANWCAYLAWFKVRRVPTGIAVQGRTTPTTDPEGAVALLAMAKLLDTQPVDAKGNFVTASATWTQVAETSTDVQQLVDLSGLVRRPLDVSVLTRNSTASALWAGSF